jgi:hypothetical protein
MAAAPAKNPLSGSGALQGKVGQFTDHPRNPVVGRTGRIGFVFGSLNAGMTLSCHLPIVKKKNRNSLHAFGILDFSVSGRVAFTLSTEPASRE